jgi:subtilisin family serine protease
MKMKKLVILLFLMMLFGSKYLFAQDFAFYIRVEDKSLIKKIQKDEKTKNFIVKTNNTVLNAILSKYKFKVFKQAFPTSQRVSLKKIYFAICDDEKFGLKLESRFNKKIISVYKLDGELTYTPNDYGLAMGQSNLDLVNAKDAWDICLDFPKISIGVSDNYFDLNHEDLNMTHFGGSNTNVNYHGTSVAGCIAAISDNNIGLASIGFNTELFVHNDYGPYEGDNAVLELAQAGHRVINCSWYSTCSAIPEIDTLYQDIRNIYNTIVVFGAGNSGSNHCGNNKPSYPASYDVNIAVTSVGHINEVGSSQSPVNNNWKDVHEEIIGDSLSAHKHHATMDICAPGYNISTTDITGSSGNSTGNYTSVWGTSFAAPQVAGTLGLIISVNPCLSADEAADILLSNTNSNIYNIPQNQRYIGRLGTGRLDVYASVNAAAESATTYLDGITLSSSQVIEDNYAIRVINNVTIASGANIDLITRKEVTIDKNFTVPLGATLTIDVDVNNTISCN